MSKLNKFIVFLSIGLVFCEALAQDIHVRANAYPTTCLIGDPIRFCVAVSAPEQAQISFPQIHRFGEFEILNKHTVKHQRTELQGIKNTIAEWDIALYRLGKATIPPMEITYQLEGKYKIVKTNPVDIEIVPIAPPKAKDPRPLKPPLPYPLSPISVAILLALSSLGFGMVWLTGRMLVWTAKNVWSQFQRITTKPPLPSHILALQAIDRAEQLYRQGEIERSFIVLSFSLRRYLKDRFLFPAIEMPTWKLSQQLKQHLPEDCLNSLRFVLDVSDLTKFACYMPRNEEADQMFNDARKIIQITMITTPT